MTDQVDWKKLILETYRNHSIGIKQIQSSSDCYGNHQWAWFHLGECIADEYQWMGFMTGLLASLVFTSARYMAMLQIRKTVTEKWTRILTLTFFMDVFSLVGAVLAMQLFQVILFDFMLALMDVFMLILLLVSAMPALANRRAGYATIGHNTAEMNPGKDSDFKLLCKASCITLGFMALPVVMRTAMAGHTTRRSLDHNNIHLQEPQPASHYAHAVVNSCGYLIGSAACFGHWLIQLYILAVQRIHWTENSPGHPFNSFSSRVRCTILITCDLLYIVGVLLHSRGWMVFVVTLPWVMQRILHVGFETINVCPSLREYEEDARPPSGRHYDLKSLTQASAGPGSDSDSDSSNVLWDRTWKPLGIKDPYIYYDQNVRNSRILSAARQKFISGDVTTSIESDWSTTSIEQELEWEDETMLHMPTSSFHQVALNQQRAAQPYLAPLTLAPKMTQSRVERVRSWVSSSSPEEEKTPCLTVALDLDHNSNLCSNPFCEEDIRKMHYVPKRKYSL